MDIVIISEFCGDFSSSDNHRFLYLAKMLREQHEIELITSGFLHTAKARRKRPKETFPIKVTFLKEPGYPRNICLRRFYSHFIWGTHIRQYLRDRKKPDVICCAVPSLTAAYQTAAFCRKNGIRFVVDIQDLWPEAFQMVLNIPVLNRLIFSPFRHLANVVYRQADSVCAVSETYVKRALRVNHKCRRGHTVFLGTDLRMFDKYAETATPYQKDVGSMWLAYCGTMGSSYDLTCVIDALAILRNRGISICLIAMGDGPLQKQFQSYAGQMNVEAVFTGRLPYDQMCALLCKCDITVNPIMPHAAQSIINKHADYAASGLPVVSTQENVEYRNLIEQYHMGFNCKNNDASDLAAKLERLVRDSSLREEMGRNARRCAEEVFDRARTYLELRDVLTEQGA